MAEYKAVILWQRDSASFTNNRYSRVHRWLFDGGLEVPASSSPHIVPLPFSDAAAVDPEEAFVASLSSCHMLWFLWVAVKRGIMVESYHDEAIGVLEKDASGKLAMRLMKSVSSPTRLGRRCELNPNGTTSPVQPRGTECGLLE